MLEDDDMVSAGDSLANQLNRERGSQRAPWALEVLPGCRSAALTPGSHVIGSGQSKDLPFSYTGLDGVRAVLVVDADSLSLEVPSGDPAIGVNGRLVGEASLGEGDQLNLGGMRLVVRKGSYSSSPLRGGIPATRAMDRFRLASELVQSLERGSVEARQEATELLRKIAGATGIAIARWNSRDPPSFVAGAGIFPENADHNDVWEFFERVAVAGRPGGTTIARAMALDPPMVCAARSRPGEEIVACAIWCTSFEKAKELRVVAKLVAELVGFDGADDAEAKSSRQPDIRLPNGIARCGSQAMSRVYAEACAAAGSTLPLAIRGETGVGKEHVALAVHESSLHRSGPFVAVNCAAIPTELAEAELFGVDAGAATGVRERPGYFRSAQRGTLFLDEVGELSSSVQAKLLRAVDSQEIHPVGGRPTRVDVRVISATNRDLAGWVEEGHFRRDLYHRLVALAIHVPPLRERPGDITTLANHFLLELPAPRTLTVRAIGMLQHYSWPGNVRELWAEIRRAAHSSSLAFLDTSLFSPHVQASLLGASRNGAMPLSRLAAAVAETEYRLIAEALRLERGNHLRTARYLGLSRGGLALKMKRLGIEARERTKP